MIDIVRRKFAARNLTGAFIVGDVLDHRPPHRYDVVVANYFFNVFSTERMPDFLAHAAGLVRPGGRLMIADIAMPEGAWLGRLFVRFYARLGMLPFWIAGLVAWHPIHDYAGNFSRFGLQEVAREDFPLFPFGPTMFRLVIARKTGDDRADEAA
jgi:SAM-dependent methyltransferase